MKARARAARVHAVRARVRSVRRAYRCSNVPRLCVSLVVRFVKPSGTHDAHTGHTGPYALCVALFNLSRRLILGAYCMVNRGIPAHNEGILGRSN
eukprot:COSAG02_NODE_368_length_23727_cov_364.814367_16_plen_95_part_00